MNLLKRVSRDLTALAMAPLLGVEAKERRRRLQERVRRLEEKQKRA
jgi:hypothetical protein